MKYFVIFAVLFGAVVAADTRNERSAIPDGPLFRDKVDPNMGGKAPESGLLRAELNKIDASGLDEAHSQRMVGVLKDMPLPERADAPVPAGYHPAGPGYPHPGPYSPKPAYGHLEPTYGHPKPAYGHLEPSYGHPEPAYGHPEPAYGHPEPGYGHPDPGYGHPEPSYGHPEPAYGTPKPGYGSPKPGYGPPAPYKPKGPVLLDHKPYEAKDIRPVEIVTYDAYTSFDCRGRHYETFYADEEAGCQIYHLCQANGQQDTFHCPYGTIFNEYIGTCDHIGAAKCYSGEGYKKPPPPVHKPGYHEPPASYHEPAPYHPSPAPYHPSPAPYHPSPAPYHPTPAPYHPTHEPYHHPSPAPYHPTPTPYHSPTPEPYHHPSPAPYHPTPTPYQPAPYSSHPHEARAYKAPFVHF